MIDNDAYGSRTAATTELNGARVSELVRRNSMAGKRLAFVDCLRACAVILVFITHSTEVFRNVAGGGVWLANLAYGLDFGRVGVVIFFAISGFLIPSSLKGDVPQGCVRFAVTRFFRLYPAFWISILPAAAAEHWLFGEPMGLREILLNATMLPRFFGVPMANGAYWTLEVELFFYVTCAFLFSGGLLRNNFVITSLTLILGFLFYTSQGVIWGGLLNPVLSGDAFFFWFHISIMFWGATCRQLWEGERLGKMAGLMFWTYTSYLLGYRPISLAYHLIWLRDVDVPTLRMFSANSGPMLIFFAFVFIWPLHTRLLAWVGRISYSFYLLHAPAIYLTLWLVARYKPLQGANMLAYLAASFGLTLIFSAISYYQIEAPFVSHGRKVSQHLLRLLDPPSVSVGRGTLRRSTRPMLLLARSGLRWFSARNANRQA